MSNTASVEAESRPLHARWERLRTEAVWTPEVRAFAKKADLAVLYFETISDSPSWLQDAAFVEMKLVQEAKLGRKTEKTMYVKFAGFIGTGHRDDLREVTGDYSWKEYSREPANLYRPTRGSWLLYLYPNQATHAHSILMSVAANSALEFRVRLDYHTSPVLAERGLHGDVLTVEARKGKRRLGFDLDTQCTRHNSARFGF